MQPLSIPSRRLEAAARGLARARPNAAAALQAALFAATVSLVVLLFVGIVAYDESPWKFLRMVAAMAKGPAALEPDDEFDFAVIAAGLALYYALAMLYGLAAATLLADCPRHYANIMGVAFGFALYSANFHGFTALFPWFAEFRTVDTLAAHLVFGFLLARAYCALRSVE
jgi:hypothetical protein